MGYILLLIKCTWDSKYLKLRKIRTYFTIMHSFSVSVKVLYVCKLLSVERIVLCKGPFTLSLCSMFLVKKVPTDSHHFWRVTQYWLEDQDPVPSISLNIPSPSPPKTGGENSSLFDLKFAFGAVGTNGPLSMKVGANGLYECRNEPVLSNIPDRISFTYEGGRGTWFHQKWYA